MGAIKEKILLNVILPLAEKVVGTCACKWYREIMIMNLWTPEQVKDWQEMRLRVFVKHAYEHTVYYKEIFDSLGLRPEDIQHVEDLKKLPILTKEIVRERWDDLIADNVDMYPHRKATTGGSSGSPMAYLEDKNIWGYTTAAKIVAWKTNGYHYGDEFVALGSASLFKKNPPLVRRVYDKIRGEIALNSMNMDDQLCAEYVSLIQKKKIKHVYGYASAIYLLALYVRRNHIHLKIHAYTTSENLTDTYRQLIEDTFGYRVMDCYGARDAGVCAYEVYPHLYQLGYIAVTELVDEIKPGIGTMLSTCFENYCMPLIRYDFGDVVQLARDDDYNGQVIKKIWGRTSDVLRLDNGHILTSPGFTILFNKFDVVAYDIQKMSGTEVKVKIQPVDGKWNNTQEKILKKEMERFVGEGCSVCIEYVDHFEPLKNGKRRYFMNDCSK